ncbi:MAG: hypothetical protein HQ518_07370 [Rhodopirellula sp.]|nr:hypothetical protein [Rhodopirellula sp.]
MSQSTNSSARSSNGQSAVSTDQASGDDVSEPCQQLADGGTMAACCDGAVRMIKERPLTSVMALFGVGLGAGVAVGCLLSKSSPGRSSMADEIGRKIVESLSRVVPESFGGKP